MDKKEKILRTVLIAVVCASVVYTFYNTVIWQNYEIQNIETLEE